MLAKGLEGEKIAADYLISQGYKIVTKNFRSKSGEVDIIAFDEEILCFIEVKYYQKASLRDLHDAVNEAKQQKIIRTAEYYLAKNNITDCYTRFDTVLIAFDREDSVSSIDLYKDAFRCN